ncbi:MAG TPA: hypothetical protein VH640_11430 [Bryobacteraceae bacterium]|jgi:hypothetical protein
MCDYSLMNVPNRLAVEGEELIVHRFPSGAMGMASPEEANPQTRNSGPQTLWGKIKDLLLPAVPDSVTAVCIPPGARLMLRDIPEKRQRRFEVVPAESVVFTQLTNDEYRYRDAVRFSNGYEVLIQELKEGQRARILSLDGTPELSDPAAERFFVVAPRRMP